MAGRLMVGLFPAGAGIALACYAAIYLALLYHPVLIRLDDFGYLRSVAETLAMGRPYTNAWLEPYSAVTSSLSALAYLATGNFIWATWGLHALIAMVNFLLVYRLLLARMHTQQAAVFALGLVLFPVYAHKTSEFSGNALTITFMLSAFLAYRGRHWIPFYAFTFLAFANRQNAIALLALPAWEYGAPLLWGHAKVTFHTDSVHPQTPAERRSILVGGLAFLAVATFFHFSMNRTVAQDLGIYTVMNADRLAALGWNMAFGLCAALALFSVSGWFMGEKPGWHLRNNLARPLPPLAATVFLVVVVITGELPLFSFLTPLIGTLDRDFLLQYVTLALFPIAFWTLDWTRLRPSAPLFLFAGFTLISGLKGNWYDFYLLDLGIAAWFYRLMLPKKTDLPVSRLATWLALALVALGVVWAAGYRVLCDKQKLSVIAYEGLERAGRIKPPEMTDATFGYLGWKLVGAFMESGRPGPLSGFQGFVKRDCVLLDTEAPWRRGFKRSESPGAELLAKGQARIGFMDLQYRMLKLPEQAGVSLLGETPYAFDEKAYALDPYPLNAREWDDLIEKLKQTPNKMPDEPLRATGHF